MNPDQYKELLSETPADRKLIDALYDGGSLSRSGKIHALNLLNPHNAWAEWIARILVALGITLVLSGIIYFFAFNWFKLSPLFKFTLIELCLLASIIGAYVYTLQTFPGKMLLLVASVFVGVFLAVFGQVYQTGADAYQLFLAWSALILAWTIIANFTALWVLWLIVSNLCLILWWDQAALPSIEMREMIFSYLILFNGLFLFLRECLVSRYEWLSSGWSQRLLTLYLLIIMLIPILTFTFDPGDASKSLLISSGMAFIGLVIFYLVYQFKFKNLWVTSMTVIATAIIVEVAVYNIVDELIMESNASFYLTMGILTLAIFSIAIKYLHLLAKSWGKLS